MRAILAIWLAVWQAAGGSIKFDGTITLGNVLTGLSFLALAVIAWRDMNWRVKNLEVWRTEHMVDSDSRDAIIQRMDKILFYVTGGKEGTDY